jgi:hypothetical protein
MGMPHKLNGKSDKKSEFPFECPQCKEKFSEFYVIEDKFKTKEIKKLCPHCEHEFRSSELPKH